MKGFSDRKALGNVRLSCVGALLLTNENAVLMPIYKLSLTLSIICFADSLICWIAIYPLDSVICPLYNWALEYQYS